MFLRNTFLQSYIQRFRNLRTWYHVVMDIYTIRKLAQMAGLSEGYARTQAAAGVPVIAGCRMLKIGTTWVGVPLGKRLRLVDVEGPDDAA